MQTEMEDLRALQTAEAIADSIWSSIAKWDAFAKDTVGKQLARAADSVGANIAESFGRFHYRQKIEFLYYARGSLFETKYWLNRVLRRNLMPVDDVQKYSQELTGLARGLSVFVKDLRSQRNKDSGAPRTIHEDAVEYLLEEIADFSDQLFTDDDLAYLESLPEINLSIS